MKAHFVNSMGVKKERTTRLLGIMSTVCTPTGAGLGQFK